MVLMYEAWRSVGGIRRTQHPLDEVHGGRLLLLDVRARRLHGALPRVEREGELQPRQEMVRAVPLPVLIPKQLGWVQLIKPVSTFALDFNTLRISTGPISLSKLPSE